MRTCTECLKPFVPSSNRVVACDGCKDARAAKLAAGRQKVARARKRDTEPETPGTPWETLLGPYGASALRKLGLDSHALESWSVKCASRECSHVHHVGNTPVNEGWFSSELARKCLAAVEATPAKRGRDFG